MVLAEALLRVPDAATQDRLIEDKLGGGDWGEHAARRRELVRLRLDLGARPVEPHRPARARRPTAIAREPRPAARPAGGAHRHPPGDARPRPSFRARRDDRGGAPPRPCVRGARLSPFLRHARRRARARRRRRALLRVLCRSDRGDRQVGARHGALPDRPGISVKLSALHPRYEAVKRERVIEGAGAARSSTSPARRSVYDLELHRRRRGGRPARTLARRDRRRLRRSVARRLGRLRPRRPGLPEARGRR